MFAVETSVDVGRPVDEVFAFVTDPRNDIRWWRGVRTIEVLHGDGGVGTEYAQRGRLFGLPFFNHLKVEELDPPHRMVMRTIRSLTPFVAVYTLTALDGGRTRFAMTAEVAARGHFRLFGPLFAPLLRWLTRLYFARLPKVLTPAA